MATNEDLINEPISSKVSHLNQVVQGKYPGIENKSLVSRDGLLDALLVLYDECTHGNLMKNQYVADFVQKYSKTVNTLKYLRVGIDDFEVKNVIGRGHFGEVEVVREKRTGDVYALKVLRKADTLAQKNVTFYEEERDILSKSNSTWLTPLQYAFQDSTNLYLVMEFHPGGDLLSLLGRFDNTFEESMAGFYLAEMVIALHALHTMGYAHRDVKPENVLIDRTGHVKLADFGSACRIHDINSSVSDMPVGTPDYICPEVLIRMNTSQAKGKFGPECDWWSLGVCGYEMMFGTTPFTSDDGSMVTTYANIMNFKNTLKFPTDVISKEAENLIRNLLMDVNRRLKYEEICVHDFFSEIDLDNIRQTCPPFIPTVTSNDDTSNFEEFDKPRAQPYLKEDPPRVTGFTGKDLPFIGFTFTKSLGGNDRLPSLTDQVASPACKNSLERRLTTKSQELQQMRERYKNSEDRENTMKAELTRLESQTLQKDSNIQKLEVERSTLERDLAHYITEANSLKRLLELEKQQRTDDENKALRMIEEITRQSERAQRIKEETELEQLYQMIRELESEKMELVNKCERVVRELKKERKQREDVERSVNKMHGKLKQHKESTKTVANDQEKEIETLEIKLKETESNWQSKLEKIQQHNQEVTEMLQEMREAKNSLEKELMELHMERTREAKIKRRLFDSEEKRKSLESQVHKLFIMEKRETQLKEEIEEKTEHVQELSDTLADLEEKLENREIEYKKCERIYAQREEQNAEKIQDLELQLLDLRDHKNQLEETSFMVCEENEEKLKTINTQEETIDKLKSNLAILEEQVIILKSSFERTASISTTPGSSRKNTPNRSVVSPCSSPMSKKPRRVSGWMQTEPLSRASGSCQTDDIDVDICATQTSFMKSPSMSPSRSRSRSPSPHKQSFQIQTEPIERLSGGTQTSFIQSPRRRHSRSPAKKSVSFMSQTSPESSFTDSLNRGSEVQNSLFGTRRSNLTIKSPVAKKSHQVQTDIAIPWDKNVTLKQGQTSITVEVKVRGAGGDAVENSFSSENSMTSESSVDTTVDSKLETSDMVSKTDENTMRAPQGRPFKVKSTRTHWMTEGNLQNKDDEKELKRKYEEKVSDMKQEKIYLEYKVDTLEAELKEWKDGTYQQRIRALDLKQDLREASDKLKQTTDNLKQRTTHYDTKIDELKEELTQLKVSSSEANINMKSAKEKEAMMKTRLEKAQSELDQLKLDTRKNSSKLREERDQFESQVKGLSSKCRRLEENESLLKNCLEETEEDLKIITQKYVEVVPRNREMESEFKKLHEDKSKFRLEADSLKSQLTEKSRKCDSLDQQCSRLKIVCNELESQVSDFERLNSNYEQKETTWSKDRSAIERIVENKDEEVENYKTSFDREKQLRQKAEKKRDELTKLLRTIQESHEDELNHLASLLAEQKTRVDILNHQLNQMEKERSMVEVDNKTFKRRHGILEDDTYKLKTEMSDMITKAAEFKSSNLKLSKNLEDAMQRYETLAMQNTDLQNRIETLVSSHDHEKFKMEATISQQAKLIDYLQAKVENPPKKKKGLFTGKPSEYQPTSNHPGIQLRELQHSLEHERDKNAMLKREIMRLKDELHQSRTESVSARVGSTAKRSVFSESSGNGNTNDMYSNTDAFSTPNHNNCAATLTALTLSPSLQPSPGAAYLDDGIAVPKTSKPGGTVGRKRERMRHNIQHQFATGLNTKATKCALCLGSVLFVKVASKCEACRIVCHPRCAPQMPATCGVPAEYVRLFADTLRQAKTTPTMRLPVSNLNIQLRTWMKIPKPGKQIWEKRYVVLRGEKILILENETTGEGTPLEELDLCAENTDVSIHSGVSAAELTMTASSDLPYIMRIEWDPKTTCWPGRSQYLMFLDFADKQKWVAALEAMVHHSNKDDRLSSVKVVGNMILSLGNRRLEINCTLVLNHYELLVGTDEGLHLLELNGTQDARSFVHIEGVDSVALLEKVDDLDIIIMVTGRERLLHTIKISKLRKILKQNPPTINPTAVEDISTVTTFDWRAKSDGLYLCVATADKTSISILKYNNGLRKFCKRKEVDIPDACACMLFGEEGIIIGANKFFILDHHTYVLTDFLDKTDTSLAFAAFGAAQYESFPISVLKVSPLGEREEFLLCFNVFGVFVDSSGHKTREENMKWKGLPLNFAYRQPYLFIVHFNVVQVIEVMPRQSLEIQGQKTMLNLPGPRYLGPALTSGSVYIAAIQDSATEILCYRGNMSDQPGSDDGKENIVPIYAMPAKSKKSSSKKKPPVPLPVATDVLPRSEETEFISPEVTERPNSPTLIRTLSGSPVRRRKNSDTSTTSSDSTNSTVKSLTQNFEAQKLLYQRRKEYENYQKDKPQPTAATEEEDGEPCHATIRTLKAVMVEQSRQRRGLSNSNSVNTRTENSSDNSF